PTLLSHTPPTTNIHTLSLHDALPICGAQLMECTGQAEREPARMTQHIEVMLDTDFRQLGHSIHWVDNVDKCARFPERPHNVGHKASTLLRVMRQQESNSHFPHGLLSITAAI